MYIMDVKNEDALDLLAELMEPVCLIFANPEVQKAHKEGGTVARLVSIAIKENKKEVIQILAALNGVKPEDYECTVPSLLADAMRILNDPMITSLFPSQGQSMDKTSSGSVTEITGASEA